MRKKIRELLEQRARLIEKARKMVDASEAEDRAFSDEEQKKYDAIMTDVTGLTDRVKRMERQAELEDELRSSQNEPSREDPSAQRGETADEKREKAKRDAFRRFLLEGREALSGDERRALQADSPTAGGYMVAPQQFVQELIQAVDDETFIRRLASVEQLTAAESLGYPALDNDPADADWTSELATGSEDSTMSIGKRELKPHPLAKRAKVSNKLIRLTAGGVEALVRARLAYKFGITEEKAYLTGSGAGQPLGLFTASAQGISTSRDVSTGNTATGIGADNLIECKYTLKGQYWPRAGWIFHRDAVKRISKLKDGEGQYLWRLSLQEGEPDRLLGFPVYMSEYAPNTFTTGLYVGILGDYKQYKIVEALNMTVQRLVELYAETNQVGFIGRAEKDGMPVLEEAFVRSKLA